MFGGEIKSSIIPSSYTIELTENGCYILGVKRVLSITQNRLDILLNKGCLHIVGDNLSIDKFYQGDIKINGLILSVEVAKQ